MGTFSIKEAIKFGWSATKSHFGFFVLVLLIAVAIQFFPSFFQMALVENSPVDLYLAAILINIVSAVLKVIVDLGFIKIALNIHDKKPVHLSDLWGSRGYFWRYLGGFVLFYLIIVAGFIMLVVPGIIFSLRLQYFSYLIIDKGLGPVESLRQSWNMTKGHTRHLFVLVLAFFLLNLGGVLLLVVGLFVTIPISMVAMAYLFRKLQARNAPEGVLSKRWIWGLAILGLALLILIPIGAALLFVNN